MSEYNECEPIKHAFIAWNTLYFITPYIIDGRDASLHGGTARPFVDGESISRVIIIKDMYIICEDDHCMIIDHRVHHGVTVLRMDRKSCKVTAVAPAQYSAGFDYCWWDRKVHIVCVDDTRWLHEGANHPVLAIGCLWDGEKISGMLYGGNSDGIFLIGRKDNLIGYNVISQQMVFNVPIQGIIFNCMFVSQNVACYCLCGDDSYYYYNASDKSLYHVVDTMA